MLSKLFRTRVRFDESDPVARRQAILDIADVDTVELQGDLAELARSDDDAGVRKAAISRLRGTDILKPLVADPDADIAAAAAEALAVIALAGTGDTASELYALPGVRSAALRMAREPETLDVLAQGLSDEELVRLGLENRFARMRHAIAERVLNEAALFELERGSRDRDKNVNRLARTRLDDIKLARAEQEITANRALQLFDQLQRLQQSAETVLLKPRLAHLQDEWRLNLERRKAADGRLARYHATTAASADVYDAFEPLADAITDSIAAQVDPESIEGSADSTSQPAPVAEQDTGAFDAALSALDALVSNVASHETDVLERLELLRAEHSRLQQLWLSHADQLAPPEDLASRFHALTHQMAKVFEAADRLASHEGDIKSLLSTEPPQFDDSKAPSAPEAYQALWERQRQARQARSQIEKLLKKVDWPTELPIPARMQNLARYQQLFETFDRQCHTRYEALVTSCQQVSADLANQIEEGHLNPAVALETEGRRLLRCLPQGSGKHYHQQFHGLSARLQELKDWQNFATSPKRRELCEQVEALAAHPLEPKAQADRIKALRHALNALGPITHFRDRRLLDRFNAAAERAFEPCRAFFEAEAARRRFNLEQREVICTELEWYLQNNDWANTDWKAAEKILHTAQNEWRKFYPVDRSAGRKSQQRFDALQGELHQRLKAEWDSNIAAKEAIVAQARELCDSLQTGTSELPPVIEQAKQLQRNWRNIGITPRGPDQKLWRAFRSTCDDIFNFRDRNRDAQQRAAETAATQFEALCDEFQQQLDNTAPDSIERAMLNDFKRGLDQLGEPPREARARLQQRVNALESAFRHRLRDAEMAQRRARLDGIEKADRALGKAELDLLQGNGAPVDDIESRLPTVTDERLARAIQSRRDTLATAADGNGATLQAGGDKAWAERHQMTLEAEIRAALDSPPDDQQRRLALQVERLNKGFKGGAATPEDSPHELALRWFSAGPWSDPATETLADRFYRACRELLG